jgi:hypothetical protein
MSQMPSRIRLVAVATLLGLAGPGVAQLHAQSLLGSRASVDIQNRMARDHDYSFLRTGAQVRQFVNSGYLVPVRGNADFDLHAVSYPYARPEVELFIRRLASQYRSACGEKLVVTSLTRPQSAQPRNASARSVHPTGMAVDLRRSNVSACRSWLESVLLSLEGAGVLEATRERNPPHYHVALFPRPYVQYVERRASAETRSADARVAAADPGPSTRAEAEAEAAEARAQADLLEYQVRRGDSLWTIARAHGTSVDELRNRNELRGSRIYAGQLLQVPVSRQ